MRVLVSELGQVFGTLSDELLPVLVDAHEDESLQRQCAPNETFIMTHLADDKDQAQAGEPDSNVQRGEVSGLVGSAEDASDAGTSAPPQPEEEPWTHAAPAQLPTSWLRPKAVVRL